MQDGGSRGRGEGTAPEQKRRFFQICDHDGNQWISFREANYSLQVDRIQFGKIDVNSDGQVTRTEFDAYYQKKIELLGSFREPRALPGSAGDKIQKDPPSFNRPGKEHVPMTADSISELFGTRSLREDRPDTVPLPPLIQGPVSHFDRLDIDEDGLITVKDLEWLARPIHLGVRFPTVIAILDTDHDGGVSPAEFQASMR